MRTRSARAAATDIARRVVAEAIEYLDRDLSDPVIAALAELQARVTVSHIATLARCPDIDVTGEIISRRVERYRSRQGRQLSPLDHAAETREIVACVERKLAERFAKHLRRKCA